MKWSELEPGDVVSSSVNHETCLLLSKGHRSYTWLVLNGESYMAYGSNPYTVEDVDDFSIDPTWELFRR